MMTRILIVDPCQDAADALRMVIAGMGCYDVRAAYSEEEGFAVAAELQPHVLITEARPATWLDFAVTMRTIYGCGVILHTGYLTDAVIADAERLGYPIFLKPADMEALDVAIRAIRQPSKSASV